MITSKIPFVLVAILLYASFATAAQDEDLTKGVRGREYVKQRPKAPLFPTTPSPAGPRKRPSPNSPTYRLVGPKPKPTPRRNPVRATPKELADIGITLWKFDPAKDSDDPKSIRENDPSTGSEVIGRRITSDADLAIGDVVRIAIESGTHDGHLYVIDREKYADNTYGEARLIFPNLSVVGGRRNFVQPGILLYFPSAVSFFRIDSNTKKRQVAEELIIIVSPTALVDPSRLTRGYTVLPDVEVDGWLNKFKAEVSKLELDGGAGEPMTAAEKFAGEEQAKGLTLVPSLNQEDALPQTLYRMRIKRGDPAIARIELKIKQD